MPSKNFICPDGEYQLIEECLKHKGCRLCERCAPLSYLHKVAFDRKFRRVTPSMAGNGPMLICLKATTNYAIFPPDRAFAVLGTDLHGRLQDVAPGINVLSEEKLTDEQTKGIADLLEQDEFYFKPDHYILTDWKSSGSFAVAKWAGIKVFKEDRPILDENGNEVLLKSGPNKGKVKTKQHTWTEEDPKHADRREIELQVNRYRILFEQNGFKISRMRVFAIPRDGGTYIAKNRGVMQNTYTIWIPRLDDQFVLGYYAKLQAEVEEGLKGLESGNALPRLCDSWENWGGRRCQAFCEVAQDCESICKGEGIKWPGK